MEGAIIDFEEKQQAKQQAAMRKEMEAEANGKDSEDVKQFKMLEKQQEMDDKKWEARLAAQKAVEADLRKQLAAAQHAAGAA